MNAHMYAYADYLAVHLPDMRLSEVQRIGWLNLRAMAEAARAANLAFHLSREVEAGRVADIAVERARRRSAAGVPGAPRERT